MDAQHLRRRRGQTVAEFALTLPILLILLFGIIEFGRIFQAWVTLQNSARAAARFASTGQPFVGDDDGGYNLNELVPCIAGVDRGTLGTRTIGGQKGTIQVYTGGEESLFATMYDGENCEVGDSHSTGTALVHYYRRTDLARLLLIYQEARRGAAGLALEADPYFPVTEESIQRFVYDQFERPLPRSDTRQWFNIMLCSSRLMFDHPELVTGGGSRSNDPAEPRSQLRFQTVLETSGDDSHLDAPVCLLNEIRTGAGGGLVNAGAPWIDAGGPGDRISLVITFNHPLITPLGLADFIPLQARRTAVNESFRVANALTVLQGGGQIGPILPTLPPTATSTSTLTPSPTVAPSITPLPLPTGTPTLVPGFSCNALTAGNLSFFQNRIYIDFRNGNVQETTLMSASINWRTIADYPGMYMASMALDTEVFWQGLDTSPPTVTNADPGFIAGASRVVIGGETGTYEGYYVNGPGQLSQYLTIYDFAGTSFQFSNPSGGVCVVTLALPQPTPSPTRDPNVPPVNSTATGTPDCASSLLRLEFVSWDSFGVVKLQVVNNRTVVAPFTNFSINWGNIMTRAGLAPGVLTLRQVTVGGGSPADPLTYKLWEAAAGQDTASPTVGRSEGTWRGNYTFQPRSVTPIYIDFDGTSTNLQAAFGAQLSDFNGTTFEIGCGTPGAGTNGTSGSSTGSGQIQINGGSLPTSPPTNTRGPTNTPFPTFTPSRTPTRGPATMTFTPRPTVPTSTTRPPTNTAPPPTSTTRPNDEDNPPG